MHMPALAWLSTLVQWAVGKRRVVAQGVVCIIVIAPFYGSRKPENQKKWFLRQVYPPLLQFCGAAAHLRCAVLRISLKD